MVKDFLDEYYESDFLYIPDLSEEIGKFHSLKVDVKSKNQITEIDDTKYQNLGARQIVKWMNRSGL